MALACGGALASCSPKWADGVEPHVPTSPAGAPSPEVDEKQDPLERYVDTPLGSRIRAKRIRVLLVSVGDIAVYRHTPTSGTPTFTSVLRSYTSFKGKSLEGLDDFMNEVKAAYVTPRGEIEDVRLLIRRAVEDVEYYRVDVRHNPTEKHGAVLVYEFVEEGVDRLLASQLITTRAALAVIHYTDADGWEIAANETMLAPHYDASPQGDKLTVTVKPQ